MPEYSQKEAATPEVQETTLIVLSPHFDDAVLSVGGIISAFDGPKYIVTFFAAPPTTVHYLTNWDVRSGFNNSTEANETRKQENANAANLLGARAINLGYVDNQYETRSDSDNTSLINSITGDITQIIDSVNGAPVVVIGPAYFGDKVTHADHLLVSQSFVRAITTTSHTNAHGYFYEDLPYTYTRFGDGDITLDTLLAERYDGLHLTKREIALPERAFSAKIEGINLYSSQTKAFESLGDNLAYSIFHFGMNRCPQSPLSPKPFEVIHEIN
ncbi:MAG: PIG-L family deacetylase [Nanoarchaeota archaeon]|nr:PIG-L family deacetylase [Nanoarchaeota archaeon]